MEIRRLHDMALVRQAITHPAVWPHVSDDHAGEPEDFVAPDMPAVYWLGVFDDGYQGCFLMHPHNPVCYEVHTALLPSCWGTKALRATKLAADYMFSQTGCKKIITNVPAYNRLALRLALRSGMQQEGVNTRSFEKRGVLHDQIVLGLCKESPCQQQQ